MRIEVLDKQLPIPLYHQLKAIVLGQIEAGELKPNDRLPAEEEIAERYGISKATVRQALNELALEGLVRREQGRGTFVTEPRLGHGPRELSSFTQEMSKHGLRASSRLLTQEEVEAEATVAEKLGLKLGDAVCRLRRLRMADGEPMGVQTAYLPSDLVPNLAGEDVEHTSLYEVLEKKYSLVPARAQETHFAVLVGHEEAKLLGVAEGSPGMAAERVTFLSSGRPLELVHSVMRGDRYKIFLDLTRSGG